MAQTTKADRKAAAKKASITRERKQQKAKSQAAGKKGATTRQANDAIGGAANAVKSAGGAAVSAGKALASGLTNRKRSR